MTEVAELEIIWLELGRQERQLLETMTTLRQRAKWLRSDGQNEAADEIADAIVRMNAQLKKISDKLKNVEPAYFAALRGVRRKS